MTFHGRVQPFPPRQRQEGFVTPVLDTRYASSLSDPNVPATNHLVSLSPTTLCPCHQPPRVPAPRPVPAPNHSPALTTHRSHHSPRSPPHRARAHSPQNSIRHQLSLQDYFVLEDRPPEEGGNGKGGYWRVKVGVSGVSHWYFAVVRRFTHPHRALWHVAYRTSFCLPLCCTTLHTALLSLPLPLPTLLIVRLLPSPWR
jgi:hypothetical protein